MNRYARQREQEEEQPNDLGLDLDVGREDIQASYYVTGKTKEGRYWRGGPYATQADTEPIIGKLREPHIWRLHTRDAQKARKQIEERMARGDEGDG